MLPLDIWDIPLTMLKYYVTWYTEIWLYEPTTIKDNIIKNIWKEPLLYDALHQMSCFLHETPFLLMV